MRAGSAIIDTLIANGHRVGFGVPGESYLALLEGMRLSRQTHGEDGFRFINTRHESGAGFAADAYARISGQPGLAFVTRGPGACNASIAVHTAAQDSVPMVLFVGQVASHEKGREAFQEIDYAQMFASIAKAVLEPHAPEACAGITARALALAASGRPGPVVVVLPEDVTRAEIGEVTIPIVGPFARSAPQATDIGKAAGLIDAAARPVVIAGELIGADHAYAPLAALVQRCGAGVIASFRRQDVIDNDEEAYLGHGGLGRPPYLTKSLDEADLIVLAGARPDDVTSAQFTSPRADQQVIHIFPHADILARLPASTIKLAAAPSPALGALAEACAPAPPERLAWRRQARAGFEAWQRKPHDAQGSVDLADIAASVQAMKPRDAITTNDAGNFATWMHRYLRWHTPRSQAAPANGAMGYAVPGALGARIAAPGRTVIAFVGDGGASMTGLELKSAREAKAPVKVIVCDNAVYGTILMHQEKTFGAQALHGVGIERIDFAALAESCGALGVRVERTDAFAEAFARALAHDGPALVHVLSDPRDISAARSVVSLG